MISKLKELLKIGKVDELKKENADLKEKLLKKQEVINQTNAYWKRKLYLLKKGKS